MAYKIIVLNLNNLFFRKDVSLLKDDFRPVLVVAAVPRENGMKFLRADGQIVIDVQDPAEVWRVLEHCNGYNKIEMIAKLAKMEVNEVSEIIKTLVKLKLVVDAREQFLHFQRISSKEDFDNCQLNSGTHWKEMSGNLKADQMLGVCRSVYQYAGLSSKLSEFLKVYVLIERTQGEFAPGYYRYDIEDDNLLWFSEADKQQLSYCFDQKDMPYGTVVQLVFAMDFSQEKNCNNRDYRMMLVEIGRKIEWLTEHLKRRGLSLYEVDKFRDEPLTVELEMEDKCWPVMVLALANEPVLPEREEVDKASLIHEMVGEEQPVKDYWINSFGREGSCVGATAVYKSACGAYRYAGATGTTTVDAIYKAVIEGYERWVSGQVRVDCNSKAMYLRQWIDPYRLMPLTPEQVEKSGLRWFDSNLQIDWTVGRDHNHEGVFIPSDIVYYGQKPSENQIYHGHSSGIAAFPDLTGAKYLALTELVERDALMRNWFLRKSPRMIARDVLPLHVQKRILHWREQGRRMLVLELDSAYGWVYEVIVVSPNYPCFVSGAAATLRRATIPDAINKAMEEAEYNLLLAIKNPSDQEIDPKTVTSPIMHGMVYYSKCYAESLSWLWSGKTVSEYYNQTGYSLSELNRMLKLITVDMSLPGAKMKVVRVFSPKLVPISFGYNLAHYTHPEICDKVDPASLEMPHYFA